MIYLFIFEFDNYNKGGKIWILDVFVGNTSASWVTKFLTNHIISKVINLEF